MVDHFQAPGHRGGNGLGVANLSFQFYQLSNICFESPATYKIDICPVPMISKFCYGVNPSNLVLKSALSESFFKILITSDYGKKQDRKGHNIAYIQ